MNDLPEITDVRKVTVEPGDIIVVRCAQHLSPDSMAYMRDKLTGVFAPAKVVVLDGGLSLDVLTVEPVVGSGL